MYSTISMYFEVARLLSVSMAFLFVFQKILSPGPDRGEIIDGEKRLRRSENLYFDTPTRLPKTKDRILDGLL